MARCETCYFAMGRFDNQGVGGTWCHFYPPKMVGPDTASFPPVMLISWCGAYEPHWRNVARRLWRKLWGK